MRKKIVSTLLIVGFVFILSACLKKEKADKLTTNESEVTETEISSVTIVETIGPIGLGRIPADDVIIETRIAYETTESTKNVSEQTSTKNNAEIKSVGETTGPIETVPEEQSTQRKAEEELQPETQPLEENIADGESWGGGRA